MFAPTTETKKRRSIWVRLGVVFAALLTLWHIFASFLWIGPVTPLREVVPGNVLSSYMIPWFGQSWSVFAPAPINGDYKFEVRAVTANDDGEEQTTDWADATAAELSTSTHHPFPPRAAGLATNQAMKLKQAWDKLSVEQKAVAELNYFKNDNWLGRMQAEMEKYDNKDAVVNYIVQERYSDAYATQVAHALWGEGVVRVQFRVSRQDIIPFQQRHNPDAERPAPTVLATGWRGEIVLPSQDEDNFANTFLKMYEGQQSK